MEKTHWNHLNNKINESKRVFMQKNEKKRKDEFMMNILLHRQQRECGGKLSKILQWDFEIFCYQLVAHTGKMSSFSKHWQDKRGMEFSHPQQNHPQMTNLKNCWSRGTHFWENQKLTWPVRVVQSVSLGFPCHVKALNPQLQIKCSVISNYQQHTWVGWRSWQLKTDKAWEIRPPAFP